VVIFLTSAVVIAVVSTVAVAFNIYIVKITVKSAFQLKLNAIN